MAPCTDSNMGTYFMLCDVKDTGDTIASNVHCPPVVRLTDQLEKQLVDMESELSIS